MAERIVIVVNDPNEPDEAYWGKHENYMDDIDYDEDD